jgi:hypothetical protein
LQTVAGGCATSAVSSGHIPANLARATAVELLMFVTAFRCSIRMSDKQGHEIGGALRKALVLAKL